MSFPRVDSSIIFPTTENLQAQVSFARAFGRAATAYSKCRGSRLKGAQSYRHWRISTCRSKPSCNHRWNEAARTGTDQMEGLPVKKGAKDEILHLWSCSTRVLPSLRTRRWSHKQAAEESSKLARKRPSASSPAHLVNCQYTVG